MTLFYPFQTTAGKLVDEEELREFFLYIFFGPKVVDRARTKMAPRISRYDQFRQEHLDLVEPSEQVCILAAMGIEWAYDSLVGDVFQESTEVMPFSFVRRYIMSMQRHHPEHCNISTVWYDNQKYLGKRVLPNGLYPPKKGELFVSSTLLWNRTTNKVEQQKNGTRYTRRQHKVLDVEYPNMPSTDHFLLKYAGEPLARAIKQVHVHLTDSCLPMVDIFKLSKETTRKWLPLHVDCCRLRCTRGNSHGRMDWTHDMHADSMKYFEDPQQLKEWISQEIVPLPAELRFQETDSSGLEDNEFEDHKHWEETENSSEEGKNKEGSHDDFEEGAHEEEMERGGKNYKAMGLPNKKRKKSKKTGINGEKRQETERKGGKQTNIKRKGKTGEGQGKKSKYVR